MHCDAEHDVQIRQVHYALVEQVDVYTLDTETYTTFLQLSDDEREDFILTNARQIDSMSEIIDLRETIEVTVEDLG